MKGKVTPSRTFLSIKALTEKRIFFNFYNPNTRGTFQHLKLKGDFLVDEEVREAERQRSSLRES